MAALVNFYCPRCDRGYTGKDPVEVERRVRKHVQEQHPDHDPDWGKGDEDERPTTHPT